ncbi:MAG: hypothetical protein AVDCRST_MAG73-865, partial [uncultured Thermomicrobiales bacterium]
WAGIGPSPTTVSGAIPSPGRERASAFAREDRRRAVRR